MRRLGSVLLVLLLCGSSAWGWWPRGHGILTRAAIEVLPSDAPAFLKAGSGMVAHAAVDPDVAKTRSTLHLEKAGHPAHYFNLELVDVTKIPASRYEFGRMCAEANTTPERVGTLPYVAAEWTEMLAVAFAEYRKWPENPFIQNKCLVYAGLVAHFAQEICQPLNMTIYWNGRGEDGKPKNQRLHEKVDGLIQNLGLESSTIADGITAVPVDSLMGGITNQIVASAEHVESGLGLGKYLIPKDVDWKNEASVRAFAEAHAKESARFTAALWLTAWQKSETVRLAGWINRGDMDHFGAKKK